METGAADAEDAEERVLYLYTEEEVGRDTDLFFLFFLLPRLFFLLPREERKEAADREEESEEDDREMAAEVGRERGFR